MPRIYLDYASTTPVDGRVLEAMTPFFKASFGNASSAHSFGQEALKAVEDARLSLARSIGAQPQEMIFTSGATESNNQAISGVIKALQSKGNHIIVSPVEHHAVFEPIALLEKEGFKVSFLNVDSYGLVDPQEVKRLITKETILIAVMHANNEIGTVQPVEEIGTIAQEAGIYFLVDAAQTVGHTRVNVHDLKCDLLSLSAHKFYGPKGVGALYIRQGTKLKSFLLGGDQERGRRASTLNVPGIVGLGQAIDLAQKELLEEMARVTLLRDKIIHDVLNNFQSVRLNGHPTRRLPHNVHFSFDGLLGEMLVASLDLSGIAVSMGSACVSGSMEPSHVLKAIGLSDELALGSLRISLGRWTTQEEISRFLEVLKEKVNQLLTFSPLKDRR